MDDKCFNKVLVAVNNSDLSERVIEQVKRMADKDALGEICIISMWNYYNIDYSKLHAPVKEKMPKEKALALLNFYQEQLKGKGIDDVKTLLLAGEPADTILEESQKDDYDLIIMGSRHLNKFQEIVSFSVSDKVVRLSPIPVLVVK